MVAIPWSLVNTFSIPILLFLFSNGLSFYRSIRASYNQRKPSIRPVPAEVTPALNILFFLALGSFVSTLPYFAPPNIFQQTSARMQTPTDVIYHRLTALRALTDLDQALRSHLATRDGRLLYFAFGPNVLAGCSFCLPSEPITYTLYTLPALVAPHLVALAVFGLATTSITAGSYGPQWRRFALYTGLFFLAGDVWLNVSYDIKGNTQSTQTSNIDFFYWRMRMLRGIAIACSSMAIALGIWLSSTNRFFLAPVTPADRLANTAMILEQTAQTMLSTGYVRNAVVRDRELRDLETTYWQQEASLFEQREVVDAVKVALTHVNMPQLRALADQKATEIVSRARTTPSQG